jgi:hypothetical protein
LRLAHCRLLFALLLAGLDLAFLILLPWLMGDPVEAICADVFLESFVWTAMKDSFNLSAPMMRGRVFCGGG